MKRSSRSSYGMSFNDMSSLRPIYSSSSSSSDDDDDDSGGNDNDSPNDTRTPNIATNTNISKHNQKNRTKNGDERASVQISNNIALFGAQGTTGSHFLRLALDAGYHVKALVVSADATVSTTGSGSTSTSKITSTTNAKRTKATAAASSSLKKNSASASASTLKNSQATVDSASAQLQEFDDQPAFTKMCASSLEDSIAIRRTLKNADFVVCLWSDTLPAGRSKKNYPNDVLAGLMRRLYPLMQREDSIRVFLYQVSL